MKKLLLLFFALLMLNGCAALGFLAMGCDSGKCVLAHRPAHHAASHHHAGR